MSESNSNETWVNVTEGAEITGYHRDHIQRLARDNWNKPEAERVIRVNRHSNGYMIWLPDLIKFVNRPRTGPRPKRKQDA